MRYDELAVEIRALGEGEPVVEVRSSNYGRSSGPLRLPFSLDAVGDVLSALERRLRHVRPPESAAEGAGDGLPTDPREVGEGLFQALFSDATARTFERAFARVEDRQDEDGRPLGLRIRFVFDPEDPDLTPWSVVPWELLFRPATREFLSQGRRTPVVRCLDVPRPVRPLPVEGKLRVLLIESSPMGVRRLDVPRERLHIQEELAASAEEVEILELPRASLGCLRDFLLSEPVHVVHFMGHGDLTPDGEGLLSFEDEGGWVQSVPAETLASHLRDRDTLKLVVLNACTSGAFPRDGGRDPFTATAASLAMAGIPAVVAMQFPVSDRAAIRFSTALYRRLAARDPIEAAVTEGRLAVLGDEPCSAEWITPVVYLRGERGELFAESAGRGEGRAVPVSGRQGADELEPLRLGVRSLVGLGEGLEEAADRTLSLTEHFDDRDIRDESLWSEAILPALRDFLAEARTTDRPVILDLAAHHSIAFLCGALLEAKSGVNLGVFQRGMRGREIWLAPRPGEVVEEPVWSPGAEDVVLDPDGRDVAAAVSVTNPVVGEVVSYLDKPEQAELRVRRVLDATIQGGPSNTSVRDGAHALRLAQTLARRLRGRPVEERRGTVRVFAAAPNALLVYLGQIAPLLGRVRIYEYNGLVTGEPDDYWAGVAWEPSMGTVSPDFSA